MNPISFLQPALGLLPFVFLIGVTLVSFGAGADRPRAFLDGFLAWALLSDAATEFLNVFAQIAFVPFLIVWTATCAIVLVFLWRRRARVGRFFQAEPSPPLLVVALFAGVTLFIALTAAPNNWDSLSYHLPKIEHWIQDRSLAFYPTANSKQNEFSPLAEMMLLQTRVLGGTDRYYLLIQWLSMTASLFAVFRITRQLGGSATQGWIAAIFLVTLPIGILESTSTQNDYVETALLAVFVMLGIEAVDWKLAPPGLIVAASLAGALSGLVKPLAFVMGLGFAAWFAIALGRGVSAGVWLRRLAAALIVLAVVLGPFSLRFFHSADLAGVQTLEMNGSFGIRQTLDNLVRQAVSNLAIGIPVIDRFPVRIGESLTWRLGLQKYRVDTSDPDYGVYTPPAGLNVLHEDFGPNPLHMVVLTLALIAIAIRWPVRPTSRQFIYCGAWLAGIVVFAALKRFALWEVRYHLAGFALAAPIVAVAWPARWSQPKATAALLLFFALAAAPALFFNRTRELLPLWWQQFYPNGFDAPPYLAQTRLQNLFANQPQFYEPYRQAIGAIVGSNAGQIGLITYDKAWEYPVWAMLRGRTPGRAVRIEHVDLPGEPRYPLGPFTPEVLFWNRGEGEAPETLLVDGREFRRIFQSGPLAFHKDTIAVFAR